MARQPVEQPPSQLLSGTHTPGGALSEWMEARMICMDRVAIVALLWFVVWTAGGDVIGYWLKTPGTGLVLGFLFAVSTLVTWPWVMPGFVDDWMNDPRT